jgi:hypothetical protein
MIGGIVVGTGDISYIILVNKARANRNKWRC